MIGIVGAGISGLTLAWHLQQQNQPYHLWEAAAQPGGYIRSERIAAQRVAAENGQSYLRELGPNSLLGDQTLLDWIGELGLTPDLVFSNPVSKARFIYRNGHYRKLPTGPPALLFGSFFSWATKRAIWRERGVRSLSPPGETLGQFFRRRFSSEIVDYALGPFVAGIYAGDPEQLLVAETFPQLIDYEQEYGSVLRGFIKNQGKTARRQSFSFRDGMQMLPDALAAQLTHLHLSDAVQHIARTPTGWAVTSARGTREVTQLVLTGPADATARLLSDYAPAAADALNGLHYPPMTAVHSAYKRADVAHPLNGFGGLNPKVEGRFSAGHIWSSSIFGSASRPTRCPPDEVLLTTFVGGQQNPDNARLPDADIYRNVHQELVAAFGIRAEAPHWRALYRWERAIPQYDQQYLAVKQAFPPLEAEGLFVCANWLGGVSLSDCIRKARELASKLTDFNNFY